MRPVPPVRSEAQGTQSPPVRPASYRSALRGLARLLGAARRGRPNPRTLPLALECRACRRTYRYEVETVYMDPAQAAPGPLIEDRIQCQGCGRWDDYTLTADAHAELLIESLRILSNSVSGKGTPRSPIVLVSLGLHDGQRMHPEDGLRDYERRLAEHPGDPGLHIGYANILRFLKRIDAAETSYRRALELDPYAAEAHASLAQLAAESGDVLEAARGFERCVSILPRGHFYRIPEAKREEFAAATKEDAKRFRELGRVAGGPVGGDADAGGASPHREVARPAVGRNAPCPCGSGKKFKKCCLPSQVAEPPTPTALDTGIRSAADEELSKYLVEFAARVPRRERDRAMVLYADVHPPSAGRAGDAHADAVGFMDWFINDYQLRSSGRTIVGEVLASRPHSLTPGARALLASWRDVPLNLYEVVAVEPGTAITVRELLGTGEHRVRDVRGSNALAHWDLVAARLIPIDGAMRIAAIVIVFRPEERPWLLAEIERRYDARRQAHPSDTVEQFLKADGLLFHRLAQALAERRRKQAEDLKAVTAEGHAVVFAKARYRMTDAPRALAALQAAEEFIPSEPGPGERACFVWLKLGESARLAVASGEVPEGAIQLSGAFCATPDAEPVPTLGEVRIRGSRLSLQCLSRQRLGWGKARLAELVGNAVRLEGEKFDAIDTRRAVAGRRSSASGRDADGDAGGFPSEADDETYRAIASRHLRDHYRRWIDQPLPALGGRSARQAARVLEQREALRTLLRRMENLEDRRRMTGAAFCDVSWIRRELEL